MNRTPWAYAPAHAWGDTVELCPDEARHLVAVLRLRPGAMVTLFDGEGRSGPFVLAQTTKKRVLLRAHAAPTLHPRPQGLILATAWTKGGRRGFIVEKAVELGVQGIWFWQARFSQGNIPEDGPAVWLRQAVAAAKQSMTPWLPELRAFASLPALLAAGADRARRVLLWEKAPASAGIRLADLAAPCVVAVGPEGGLDDEEVAAFIQHGWLPRSLGSRILRAETAGVYAAALAHYQTEKSSLPPTVQEES
ncbi:MAG TPA: 16S rRNA (uracil(1498)-N(3))-methyltransferase [Desulfomicrobiaceae bacterium]|jgi:16S rRNA (uracil1498-N3)-methyltransferase|nr:16S rRNA (uracil(1498)-N(3))-methyltransferase [Desulfomicrobiaceae bacterium]